jgi:hypothetical protein
MQGIKTTLNAQNTTQKLKGIFSQIPQEHQIFFHHIFQNKILIQTSILPKGAKTRSI